jgi:succinate-semialdehyde dehydrogenase / glutarate-semialdehyde dehydrogenase
MKRDHPIGELAAQLVEGPLALKDATLLRRQAFINGEWVNANGSKTYPVTNPADGMTLAQVPDMGAEETRAAIEAANKAWPAWRGKTAKERGVILRKWFDLILANQEDLARILTAEQGKPLAESRGEVGFGAAFIDWYAEEAKRITGDVLSTYSADRRIVLLKQPVGVVGAVTPWNFPSAMVTRKCAPAIAAGCTVVLKPAEDTPLSCLALIELGVRAGMPAGVINVVTGRRESAPAIGQELTTNKLVRKISFTGSTEVGKILLRQSATTVKKVSLELGGNAPFVVFDDADLDRAVVGAMGSKFRNMGQTCVCAQRFYVQDGVYDKFAQKLVEAVKKLKVGAGWEADVTQGPLINAKAVAKVEKHIADAKSKGAKVALGGTKHSRGGLYFEPTVLTDVPEVCAMSVEETFGPVAPLYRFKTEEDVIRMANDTDYGLAGYFYTQDIHRAWRVAEALEYGVVGVNEAVVSSEVVPIGGFKESGIGREGSKYGIDAFLEIKQVTMGGMSTR